MQTYYVKNVQPSWSLLYVHYILKDLHILFLNSRAADGKWNHTIFSEHRGETEKLPFFILQWTWILQLLHFFLKLIMYSESWSE